MELSRITPTDEQWAAARLFASGESMVLDALAGTGKTSSLRLLAWSTRRRGRYIAYNKAIVTDVQGALPERCPASTAHSLAFRAVGTRYSHRLRQPRIKSWEVAHRLDILPIYVSAGLPKEKRLSPGWLAGHVMRAIANFTNSQDETPGMHHFPYADGIDLPDEHGHRRFTNNRLVAAELEGALRKAWQDLSNPDGALRFRHDDYLKIWALGDPHIEADYILLDEAQDTNPVLAGVIERQEHAQRVLVGDENQQLYEWRGAVDAMAGFAAENRRSLTQTFRFGSAIAWEANSLLEELEAPLRIVPNANVDSYVGPYAGPVDAVLCRTNARALQTVIDAQMRRQPVHLVGGGNEVAAFARAVRELRSEGRTSHHDLACFESWQEVLDYVREERDGEMGLLVRLIEEFGVEAILRAVDGTTPEGPGVLTVSTGHRAKGRQWDRVRIAEDFVDRDPTVAELRLRYVAFTRAARVLDQSVFRDSPTEVLHAEVGKV